MMHRRRLLYSTFDRTLATQPTRCSKSTTRARIDELPIQHQQITDSQLLPHFLSAFQRILHYLYPPSCPGLLPLRLVRSLCRYTSLPLSLLFLVPPFLVILRCNFLFLVSPYDEMEME